MQPYQERTYANQQAYPAEMPEGALVPLSGMLQSITAQLSEAEALAHKIGAKVSGPEPLETEPSDKFSPGLARSADLLLSRCVRLTQILAQIHEAL